MMRGEFERLRTDASAFGDAMGVSATLKLVEQSPGGARIMLRVVRFVPGESAREYAAAQGYRPDVQNLRERICADIKIAAERLGALRPS